MQDSNEKFMLNNPEAAWRAKHKRFKLFPSVVVLHELIGLIIIQKAWRQLGLAPCPDIVILGNDPDMLSELFSRREGMSKSFESMIIETIETCQGFQVGT